MNNFMSLHLKLYESLHVGTTGKMRKSTKTSKTMSFRMQIPIEDVFILLSNEDIRVGAINMSSRDIIITKVRII